MPSEQIMNAVATVGFPIIACCGLFYLYDNTMKKVVIALTELTNIVKEIKNDMEQRKVQPDGV